MVLVFLSDLFHSEMNEWWVMAGPDPEVNKLEGGLQTAPACTSVHAVAGAPRSGCCRSLCPQGKALQDQQLGLTQAPFKFMFLRSPGAYEILCASFKSEVSIFHRPLGLPKVNPAGLHSQMS